MRFGNRLRSNRWFIANICLVLSAADALKLFEIRIVNPPFDDNSPQGIT